MSPDGSKNARVCEDTGDCRPLDKDLLSQAKAKRLVSPLVSSRQCAPDLRYAVIEAQHATLKRPDKRNVKVPAHQKTLGSELKAPDLLVGHGCANLVVDADVGAILAY